MGNTGLKFIAGNTGTAASKRKVFCAFHPQNRGTAHQIMKDILNACTCYAFYYENGVGPVKKEDYESELGEMSLFVFAVSSDYLFSPSYARDVVFPFAVEHKIPILPIMIENGLEECFNQQVGNLQFILMNTERYDATTIPYAQRLGNFLSAVLMSDGEEQRLRAAFDTSIFLSYRKKDRSFAQKLMQMIHEKEDCRGIAIWYDEFLVPGEDFNDGIRSELENSSAFVLVVTPHIVEKNNYIIVTEYPAAVAMGKSVIPIEMVPTERSGLAEAYPGLSQLMPVRDAQGVWGAIHEVIEQLGGKTLDRPEERDFLRGLAYLKGIYVEKNTGIGVGMILDAAEKGVEEAVFTAVRMYRNGEGVALCLQQAIRWQKNYISIRAEEYNTTYSDEDAESLANGYLTLCGIYEQDGMLRAAVDSCDAVIQLLRAENLRDKEFAAELRATAQETAAGLLVKLGDYSAARYGYLEPALEVRIRQHEQTGTMLACLRQIETYAAIAECCENCQDMPGVKENTIHMDKLIPVPDSVKNIGADQCDLIKRLLVCYNRLGHFYIITGKWEESFLCIGNTVLLAEKLVRVSDTYDARRQLLLAYRNNGDQHADKKVENHLLAARDAYDCALAQAKELRDRGEETAELKRDIARVLSRQARVKGELGCGTEAEALYVLALEQFGQLHEMQGTLPAKKDLYDCMKAAAVLYGQLDNGQTCERLLRESAALAAEAVKASELAVYKKDQASALALLAEHYKALWDMDEALRCRKEHCALLRSVWHGTRRMGDMKAYAVALKEAVSVSRLAGEFGQSKELSRELGELGEQYGMFFGQ